MRVAFSVIRSFNYHWDMNWVALFHRTENGWEPAEFSPYGSGKKMPGHIYEIYSNMNLVSHRHYSDLSPYYQECFEFRIEHLRIIDFTQPVIPHSLISKFNFRSTHNRKGLDFRYEPYLRRHLNDPHPTVRAASIVALARLGEFDIMPLLVDLYFKISEKKLRRQFVIIFLTHLLPKIYRDGTKPSDLESDQLETLAKNEIIDCIQRNELIRLPGFSESKITIIVDPPFGVIEFEFIDGSIHYLCIKKQNKWIGVTPVLG
ncbi:HEAT repeat domain-containing protein [candidate division CSSED10-310 bacterium]|uniref:HEAT repeat domain-containing protein n=1 Tax=candidate division CSSED10-310 bacterium TaxID=2855610 RepID=A0ABV6Z068_UNCC1